jgi:acetolactate synthase-1/2/3 large subunit
MNSMKDTRRATDVIVERLIAHEVRHVFPVAGESYLDVLDALYDAPGNPQVVTCRHEASAANMAHRDKSMTQIDQPSRAPMTILRRNS